MASAVLFTIAGLLDEVGLRKVRSRKRLNMGEQSSSKR
jgi:hypothetical protein